MPTGCIPAYTWRMTRPLTSGIRKSGFRQNVFLSSAKRTTSGSTAPVPAAPVPRYTMTEGNNTAAAARTARWAASATVILRYGTMYLPSLIMTDMVITRNWSIRILIRAWGWSALLLWSRAWIPCLPWIPTRPFLTGYVNCPTPNTRKTMRQMFHCVLWQTMSSPVPS